MPFWKKKRVLITGGSGFLGTYLVREIKKRGCEEISVPRSKKYDLVEMEAVRRLYKDTEPDIVIHLAARVGGIEANQKNPGTFFYDNLMMGSQLMEEARKRGIAKFVALGTVCAYPKIIPTPFKEEDLWNGYPEETNAPYGLAKKMQLVQARAYREQYGFNAIYLLPVNLYGPGDNFNPDSSHVIPALIKKCFDCISEKKDVLHVWGTGKATREFLYAADCAEAIALATEKYDKEDPVNIGVGSEIAIKELTGLIAKLTGFKGEIIWDSSKPDGQPRRMLDISKARNEFGFTAKTDLREGLEKTVKWYKDTLSGAQKETNR